jgi:hypothetical protein
MRRLPHSWREAYELALTEPDPSRLLWRTEYALNALERRCSEWETDPGTPAEVMAIQRCISSLKRLLKQEQLGRPSVVLSIAKAPSRQFEVDDFGRLFTEV